MPDQGSAPNKTFVRSDGTRTGSDLWQQEQAAAVGILAANLDYHDAELATALTNRRMLDGGNQPSADLPMNAFKHTGVANASARTNYAAAGQVQDSTLLYAGTSSGTDTITATLSPAITAYVAGQRYHFLAGGTNTGAATVNFNAVGAKSIKKGAAGSTALVAGDITTGGAYAVVYDGTNFQLLNPGTMLSSAQLTAAIGVTVQAQDAELAAIAGLTSAADRLPYFTGSGTAALAILTSYARTLLDDNNGTDSIATIGKASKTNMENETDNLIVTPTGVRYAPGVAKFWAYVSVSSGVPSISASYNVTSITDNGVGILTVTIATDFSGASWAPALSVMDDGSSTSSAGIVTCNIRQNNVNAGAIVCNCFATGQTGGGSAADPQAWSVIGFGTSS